MTPGTFEKFLVKNGFHVGQFQMDLPKGATVEYDSVTLKFAGKEYQLPALIGAVNSGWLVKPNAVETKTTAKAAGIMVRPAKSAGQERGEAMVVETAVNDEEEVGSITKTNAMREKALNDPANKKPSPNPTSIKSKSVVGDEEVAGTVGKTAEKRDKSEAKNRPPPRTLEPKAVVAAVPAEGRVEVTVSSGGETPVDIDYGLPDAPIQSSLDTVKLVKKIPVADGAVARLGSPTKMKTVLTDVRQVDSAIANLENGKPVRSEKIVTATVESQQPEVLTKTFTSGKVAKKASATVITEGEAITDTFPNGATGDVDEARSGDDLEDLLPDAASSGLPDTFKWSMKPHWRERVKLAIEKYRNDPVSMMRVYELESESVVKQIKAGLAE